MIFNDAEFLNEFQEEIYQVRLSNSFLDTLKNKMLEDFSNQKPLELDNIYEYKELSPKLIKEINELEKVHLSRLNKEEKKIFFKQILNNLRLPFLMEERKSVQKEIIESGGNLISDHLLKKYNKISDEIKNIRNKDLE